MRSRLIIALVLFSLLAALALAATTQVSIVNEAPELVSVRTFTAYKNTSINTPATYFEQYPVYIEVKVIDKNGFPDLEKIGYRIVKVNDTYEEYDFERFDQLIESEQYYNLSPVYINDTLSAWAGHFTMFPEDERRVYDTKVYRVKVFLFDGVDNFTSSVDNEGYADYVFPGPQPASKSGGGGGGGGAGRGFLTPVRPVLVPVTVVNGTRVREEIEEHPAAEPEPVVDEGGSGTPEESGNISVSQGASPSQDTLDSVTGGAITSDGDSPAWEDIARRGIPFLWAALGFLLLATSIRLATKVAPRRRRRR